MLRLVFLVKSNEPRFFLHASTQQPLKPTNHQTDSLLHRFIAWGERYWQQWGEQPVGSPKQRLHQLGSGLIARLPNEERALWRIYSAYTHKQASPISLHTNVDNWPALLNERLSMAISKQRWGRIIYATLMVPLTLLTVLPFVKLLWAWCFFRLIARHRALHGALWLRQSMGGIKRVHDLQVDKLLRETEPSKLGTALDQRQ